MHSGSRIICVLWVVQQARLSLATLRKKINLAVINSNTNLRLRGDPQPSELFVLAYELLNSILLNNSDLLPDYEIVLDVFDDGTDPTQAEKAFVEIVNSVSPRYAGLLGTVQKQSALRLATLAPAARIPHIIPGAAGALQLYNRRQYPSYFRTYIPDTGSYVCWFWIMKANGWRSVQLVWRDPHEFEVLAPYAGIHAVEYEIVFVDDYDEKNTRWGAPWLKRLTNSIRLHRTRVIGSVLAESVQFLLACACSRDQLSGLIRFLPWWGNFGRMANWDPGNTPCSAEENIDFWRGSGQLSQFVVVGSVMLSSAKEKHMALSCAEAHRDWLDSSSFDEYFMRNTKFCGLPNMGDVCSLLVRQGRQNGAFDAMCAMALGLHNVLYKQGITLDALHARSAHAFDTLNAALQALDFIGLSGRVRFINGTGDREPTYFHLIQGRAFASIGDPGFAGRLTFPAGKLEDDPTFQDVNHGYPVWPDHSTGLSDTHSHLQFYADCAADNAVLFGSSCRPCDRGTFYDKEVLQCRKCGAGYFQSDVAKSACEICGAGNYSAYFGQSGCNLCEAGSYAESAGQTQCSACLHGKYSSLNGLTSCELCSRGHFANVTGLTVCFHCKAGLDTPNTGSETEEGCVCPQGTYFQHTSKYCISCKEKLQCPGGFSPHRDDFDTTLAVEEGYMLMWHLEELTVFECARPEACKRARRVFRKGGVIDKDNICQSNHVFVPGCGACKTGYYARKGQCIACSGVMVSPWIANAFGVGGSMLGCFLLYHKSMFPPEPVGMAWGTIFSFAQALLLSKSFAFTIPASISINILEPLAVFKLDLSSLGLSFDCSASSKFIDRFILKLIWPLFLLVGFLLVIAITTLFRKCIQAVLKREIASPVELLPQKGWGLWLVGRAEQITSASISGIPLTQRLMWYWPVNWLDLQNAMVKTQNGLFIILTTTSLTIFRFTKHPSGVRTVTAFPEVIAHAAEWNMAAPLSFIYLLIVTLGFFAFIVVCVVLAPRRVSSDPKFRRSLRCLWAKFEPGAWWFCIVHLVYALILNLVPVITHSARLQILAQMLVNACYVLVLCHIRPWKFQLNHWADLATKLGYTCFVLMTLAFQVDRQFDVDTYGFFLIIPICLPCVYVLFRIVRFLWFQRVAKLQELAARAEFAQRLNDIVKIVGAKDTLHLRSYAITLLDNDVTRLDHALDVLQFTMLGLQAKQRWRWRVAPVPFEVVVDGRLEGEMIAQGLEESTDVRVEMRCLRQFLLSDFDVRHNTFSADKKTSRIQHLKEFKGVSSMVKALFANIDGTGDGLISKEEFVETMQNRYKEDPCFNLDEDALLKIFDYIDIDQGGALTEVELAYALTHIKEPVLPDKFKIPDAVTALESDDDDVTAAPQQAFSYVMTETALPANEAAVVGLPTGPPPISPWPSVQPWRADGAAAVELPTGAETLPCRTSL